MVPNGSRHHAARVEAYRDWSIVALANHLLLFIVVLLRPSGMMAIILGIALGFGVANFYRGENVLISHDKRVVLNDTGFPSFLAAGAAAHQCRLA